MRFKILLALVLCMSVLTACGANNSSKYQDLSDEELVLLALTKFKSEGQAFDVNMVSYGLDDKDGVDGYNEKEHTLDNKKAIIKSTGKSSYAFLFGQEYQVEGYFENEKVEENFNESELSNVLGSDKYEQILERVAYEMPMDHNILTISRTQDITLDGEYEWEVDEEDSLLSWPEFESIHFDKLLSIVSQINSPIQTIIELEDKSIDEIKIERGKELKFIVESETESYTEGQQKMDMIQYKQYIFNDDLQIDSVQVDLVMKIDGKNVFVSQSKANYTISK